MAKKKGFSIRREFRRGKAVIVLRDNNKIVETHKWSIKLGLTVESAKREFKESGSIRKGIKGIKLANVREFSDFRVKKKSNKYYDFKFGRGVEFYQGIAQTILNNGKIITARSGSFSDKSKRYEAIEESVDALRKRVAEAFGETYDADKGEQKIIQKNLHVRVGIVYYKNI